MKTLPILFSPAMVRALLAGRKTQTRRLHKPNWVPGDILYVREMFKAYPIGDSGHTRYFYKADHPLGKGPWKPSIHHPKAASRIFLEVEEVWAHKTGDIRPIDCEAEGVYRGEDDYESPGIGWTWCEHTGEWALTAHDAWVCLWNSLHEPECHWNQLDMPVWATRFRLIERPANFL